MSQAGLVNISQSGGGGSPVESVSGNDNVKEFPIANNLTFQTANTTIEFLGAAGGGGEVLDFSGAINGLNIAFGDDYGGLTSGEFNVSVGINALAGIESGNNNIALGHQALAEMNNGSFNIGIGESNQQVALSGSYNTSVGTLGLQTYTGGSYNSTYGYNAGTAYTTGESSNILINNVGVIGESNVMRLGTPGSGNAQVNKTFIAGIVGNTVSNTDYVTINTATGQLGVTTIPGSGITTIDVDTSGSVTGSTIKLYANSGSATQNGATVHFYAASATEIDLQLTDGNNNIFLGTNSGNNSYTGSPNQALGGNTLVALTNGGDNTAIGYAALSGVTSGGNNISIGQSSLSTLSTNGKCIAMGYATLNACTGGSNIGIGFEALTSLVGGGNNLAIGIQAGVNYTGSETSNVLIQNAGVAAESNIMRIGTQGTGSGQVNTCYIAGITGNTLAVGNTQYVTINSSGQLGIGLTQTQITLTNAQLKALNTTPIQVVAAGAAGVINVPVSCILKLEYGGSNAFSNAPQLELTYGNTYGTNPAITFASNVTFSEATSNAYATGISAGVAGVISTAIEATGLYIGASANYTGNAGANNTVKVTLLWYPLTVG